MQCSDFCGVLKLSVNTALHSIRPAGPSQTSGKAEPPTPPQSAGRSPSPVSCRTLQMSFSAKQVLLQGTLWKHVGALWLPQRFEEMRLAFSP